VARTWLTVEVELVGGRGEFLWPRPGRVFAAKPNHTFRELADAINEAFARWDRSHLHLFALADGDQILPLEWVDDADNALDDETEQLRRLSPGERFAYVFDLGDHWEHLCTVGAHKLDITEVAGITPTTPIPIEGWGAVPDQYGRRWQADDGSARLPPEPDPPTRDLPPLLAGWGEEAFMSVASGPPGSADGPVGLWRPLEWTEEALGHLRGAVARRESGAVLDALTGRDPLEVAHQAGPGLLAALVEHHQVARGYATLLIDELRDRWWDGDHALADELADAVGTGGPTGLIDVKVELDELAMLLTNASLDAEPFRLHLPTGRFWPNDLQISGDEQPDDWEDEDRWLELRFIGSADGWHDMSDFIGTVEDGELSERLDDAIKGKGAFRRFGDRLRPHEHEWARWRRFKAERDLGRARAYLAAAGYRPAVL
jgi:hypothetical protein